MNIDHLDKIRKAEVSPFLFSRIQQRLNGNIKPDFSIVQFRLIGISLALIICINVASVYSFVKSKNSVESYAQAIHLNSDNSLY